MVIQLAERLKEKIRQEGPVTFRDWMAAALYDPAGGFYCRDDRRRWGRDGDYRTSPERSSLFAETFARYFAGLYRELNEPSQWTIVEPGAGSGHFAEGVLTTLQSQFPQVFAATTYVIDEISESSAIAAKARLANFADRLEFGSLASIPTIPAGVIFSNELLDALPVHCVTLRQNQLSEYYVTVGQEGLFRWALGAPSTGRIAEYLDFVGCSLLEGEIAEVNVDVEDWLRAVSSRLSNGYVVTVDYGTEAAQRSVAGSQKQGTLRGFRRHQFSDDVLADPGDQDLTTTIDWTFIKKFGERLGLTTVEFARQDHFLLQAGLLEQLEVLAAGLKSEAELLKARTDSREMILPNGLAASFQVLVQKKEV